MSRLETLSADLVTKLGRASAAKQRLACITACELAVGKARVEHPLVEELLRQLPPDMSLQPKKKPRLTR